MKSPLTKNGALAHSSHSLSATEVKYVVQVLSATSAAEDMSSRHPLRAGHMLAELEAMAQLNSDLVCCLSSSVLSIISLVVFEDDGVG